MAFVESHLCCCSYVCTPDGEREASALTRTLRSYVTRTFSACGRRHFQSPRRVAPRRADRSSQPKRQIRNSGSREAYVAKRRALDTIRRKKRRRREENVRSQFAQLLLRSKGPVPSTMLFQLVGSVKQKNRRRFFFVPVFSSSCLSFSSHPEALRALEQSWPDGNSSRASRTVGLGPESSPSSSVRSFVRSFVCFFVCFSQCNFYP